ncbi:uncharacterized protein CG43867 isoform X2 [Haemaphysalis longicornis]
MGEQVVRLAEEVVRLERELAQQRQLRAHQAQRAHAQAQAVRLWVAQRLRQLEEHNARLQEQNEHCNEQLEELRQRLAQLSEQLAASTGGPPDSDEAPPAYTQALLQHPTSCPGVRLERKRFRDVASLSTSSSMASPDEDAGRKGWPPGGPGAGVPDGCRRGVVAPEEELHDYAEICTPSREVGPPLVVQDGGGRPPTPPLHRFPSWESRIYEVAANGIIQSLHSGTSGASSLEGTLPGSRLHSAFSELSVPVYAAVKGRASQIRSMPFTGESSDSSDNEETSRTPLSDRSSDRSPKATAHGVRRETSAESLLSDDYAVPPDAVSTTADTLSLDSLEPPPVLSRTHQEEPPVLPSEERAEKSGYLTKLGGKLKTWKRRWFVLANGTLRYYKAQSDVGRKPRGQIALDEVCRVTRAHGATTFEIATEKRSFYLTADCTSTMEEWVRVLQHVLRSRQLGGGHPGGEARPTVDGWVTKVKHGHARCCWGALVGRTFLYFRTPADTSPLGQIPLREARVEEVLHLSDSSDTEEAEAGGLRPRGEQASSFTVALLPRNQSPTYLLFPTRQEMDAWLYHLTVVSAGENASGSQYEQLVSRLLEVDGDPGCVVWRHPLLLYAKEPLSQPLTSLASEELQAQAVRLFKSVQLFMGVPLESSGIDYHVALAQNALAQCLSCPALQNELFCQLIKQTSPHHHPGAAAPGALGGGLSQHRLGGVQLLLCATQSLFLCDSSSEKGSPTVDKAPLPPAPPSPPSQPPQQPADWVLVQGWQLLSLAVALFPPRNRTRWLLRRHLLRHSDSRSEPGQYASFCGRALERALRAGCPRECRPSRTEVLSILQRNPFHHSLPHSMPVHFLNGAYQVVGFDGSTTVDEFIGTLTQEAGLRDPSQSGFALYSDDPIDKGVHHCLSLSTQRGDCLLADEAYHCGALKLCDVISRWEQALRERHLGKVENTRVICLTFRNRLFLRQQQKAETERERLLTAYALHGELMQGHFPLTHEMALEMAALMAQMEFGDGVRANKPQQQLLQQALDRFLPTQFHQPDSRSRQESALGERWCALRGRPVQDCVRIYLNCVRKWPLCGARLFAAKMKSKEQQSLWLAVSEDGISLLDCATLHPWVRHPYSSVMTFGGCQEDFMLVVCPEVAGEPCTERLLFAMPKPQVLEVTLLVADYMNALGATGASVAHGGGGGLGVAGRAGVGLHPCSSATSSPALSTTSSRRPLLPTPDS